MPDIVRLAPESWNIKQGKQDSFKEEDAEVQIKDVKGGVKRSAWARLIKKVYGINPLICEKCGSEMQIVAFIIEPEKIDRIIQHLKKQGRVPPDIENTSAN
jgi:hypothetical protein